jgi:hypothetical protein
MVRYADDDPGIGETGGARHEEDPRPNSRLYLVLMESLLSDQWQRDEYEQSPWW